MKHAFAPIPGVGRPRAISRKQWSAALTVSLIAHVAIFLAVVAGVEHRLPQVEDQAIEVTLDRPYRPPPPPPPEPPKPQPLAKAPQPRPESKMATRPVPPLPAPPTVAPAPLPAGAAGNGQAPAAKAQGGQVAGPPAPGQVKMNCLGKYIDKLEGKARVECEQQIYAFIDRNKPNLDPAIDPDKQAAYDAAAARKANRRAPISRMGNDTTTSCPGGNLGMGCASITIPLTGSSAEKFRQGDRQQ